MSYTAAVITISDKGARGERIDTSGPALCAILENKGWHVCYTNLIPDDKEQIKAELANIRYYYSRKDTFAKAFDSVGQNGILGTVTRYNQSICMAPPRIYEVYVCLYIECCTYEAAAERLGYSVSYIYKSNKKIVDFFYEAMNQEVA